MGRGDFAISERKRRIQELEETIKKHQDIEIERLIALIQYDSGLTKRKIIEYLETLENAGFIFKDGNTYKHAENY